MGIKQFTIRVHRVIRFFINWKIKYKIIIDEPIKRPNQKLDDIPVIAGITYFQIVMELPEATIRDYFRSIRSNPPINHPGELL